MQCREYRLGDTYSGSVIGQFFRISEGLGLRRVSWFMPSVPCHTLRALLHSCVKSVCVSHHQWPVRHLTLLCSSVALVLGCLDWTAQQILVTGVHDDGAAPHHASLPFKCLCHAATESVYDRCEQSSCDDLQYCIMYDTCMTSHKASDPAEQLTPTLIPM